MELWKPTRRTLLRAGGLIACPAIIGRAMAQVPLRGVGGGIPSGGKGLQTNLSAFWEFSNSSWLDATANGNTLTPHGTTGPTSTNTAPTVVGNYANLTATDSEFLSVASNAGLQTGPINYSINIWSYQNAQVASQTFISKIALSAGQGEYRIHTSGGFGVEFAVFDSGLSADVVTTPNNSFTATNFHMICCVVDQANTLIKISIDNGTFVTAPITLIYVAGTADVSIGAYHSSAEFLDGRVDQAGYWKNRALTQTDVNLLWNTGAGLSYAQMA